MSSDITDVGPYWLERQSDLEGPDFVVADLNITHRSWTLIGNLDSVERAAVDPRGLITPPAGNWSLDWWIGADDRWRVPAQEPMMRQRLVGYAPVVETLLRVPGGEALHRAYGARGSLGGVREDPRAPSIDDLVVVEIENRTPVPFAVALAVRPYGPGSWGEIHEIELNDTTVVIDGEPVISFAKRPSFLAGGGALDPDVAEVVTAGRAAESHELSVTCEYGRASAAFVFPLAHTATLRLAMVLGEPFPGRRPRSGRGRGSNVVLKTPGEGVLPNAEQVSRGWDAQVERGTRIEVPDVRLNAAIDAARRSLLLFAGGDDPVVWPAGPADWSDVAALTMALDRYGFAAEASRLLVGIEGLQDLSGYVTGSEGRNDATGAALCALGEHWRLNREVDLAERLTGPVAKAIHWISKRCVSKRANRGGIGAEAEGLLPIGPQPSFIGDAQVSYRDAFWSLRGLRDAAELMAAVGQPEVAEDAGAVADRLADSLRASVDLAATRTGSAVIPSGAGMPVGPGAAANLVAARLGITEIRQEVTAATLDHVRERLVFDRGVIHGVGSKGLSPMLTVELAMAELAACVAAGADPSGSVTEVERIMSRIAWMLDMASPTWGWPQVIHPRTKGGTSGQGHHGATTAMFLSLVRFLLIRDVPGSLSLCPVWPRSWLGEGVEVHGAPTSAGRISFAVRWHGARPALLWELEPHEGVGPVTISIPGLDPSWSTDQLSGDTLLAPVPIPPSTGPES